MNFVEENDPLNDISISDVEKENDTEEAELIRKEEQVDDLVDHIMKDLISDINPSLITRRPSDNYIEEEKKEEEEKEEHPERM